MSKPKHTPGPWITVENAIEEGNGNTLYEFMIAHDGQRPRTGFALLTALNGLETEQRANARLIAAAPELFTLANAVANLGDHADQHSAAEFKRTILTLSTAAKHLIAKATGGEGV